MKYIMGYGTTIVRDPQTAMQLRPLQYCVNKNHKKSKRRYRGRILMDEV